MIIKLNEIDSTHKQHIYAVRRKDMGDKYVKQFSDGEGFTSQFNWVEQYTDKKAASEDARRWSKQIKPGYYVVTLI